MPNSQPQEPQELIAALIPDDPFSMEFMESANTLQVSAESLSTLPKRRVRVTRDKFVLHKDLKSRLIKLLASNCSEQAKEVARDILDLKYVPTEGKYCNYLSLSQADYTKISYLDRDREERLRGQKTTMEMIRPGTIVNLIVQKSARRFDEVETRDSLTTEDLVFRIELKLTSRHLGDRVYPIDRVVPSHSTFTQSFYGLSDTRNYSLEFKQVYLSQDSEMLRLRNTRTRGARSFELSSSGIHINSVSNWDRLIAVEFKNTTVEMQEVWNFKKRYHTSIGKIIRRLFAEKYSDRDVTAFAEAYASLITVSNPMYDFEIVEGDDIKAGYHENNYWSHSGTLGNSCMRYSRCQDYFSIYTMYPDKVKMAVLKRQGKIAARSIMWNIDGKFMFDRIYYCNDEACNLLKNTLESAGYDTLFQKSGLFKLDINLDGVNRFPYLDTLCNYDPVNHVLSNQYFSDVYWGLRSTGGDYTIYNSNYREECSVCGEEIDEDCRTYITRGTHAGSYCCENCYIYSEIDDSYITTEDDTVSTYCGDTILESDSVRLVCGRYAHGDDRDLRQYENGFGFFIIDEDFYYTDGTLFYHKNDTNIPQEAYDCYEADRIAQETATSILAARRAEQEESARRLEAARLEAVRLTQTELTNADIVPITLTSANNTSTFSLGTDSIHFTSSGSLGYIDTIHLSNFVLNTIEQIDAVTPITPVSTEPPIPDTEISLEEVRNETEAMEASAQGEAEFTTWSQIPDEAPRDMPF